MDIDTTLTTHPVVNVRHDLDPVLVKANIEKRVIEHEGKRILFKSQAVTTMESYERAKLDGTASHWNKAPEGPGYVDPMIDEWVDRELNYYALVRVIELPVPGRRFVLAYGDIADAAVEGGTGPFGTFEDAAGWFLESGR